MNNDIIERMRSGKRISETDSYFPRLCEEIENTRRLIAELNTGYHSPDEVRALLERIWGQPLDASVRMFPPFYTAFGKTTRVGKEVFINFGCKAASRSKTVYSSGQNPKSSRKHIPNSPKSAIRCKPSQWLSAARHGLAQVQLFCRELLSAKTLSLQQVL